MFTWVEHLRFSASCCWIPYIPVDGGPLPAAWIDLLQRASRIAVTSAFSQRMIQALVEDQAMAPIDILLHGVDPATFYPIPDAPRPSEYTDRFVVGCVARNQFRKHLPLLMRAFALFLETHSDGVLHLHTHPQDPGGSNLIELARRYGLLDHCFFSYWPAAIPDERLNRIYNYFDVFVLPTMGEGFGIPILEAMASGIPVIATDCSAVTELVQGRGELIRVKEWLSVGYHNIDQAIADSDDMSALICHLYQKRDLRAHYKQLGRTFAEHMTWDAAAAQWEALLNQSMRPNAGQTALMPRKSEVVREETNPVVPLLHAP